MFNLRFRTRLALVMFITMACTTAALVVTYVRHVRQDNAYTTILTSDLLQIVNVAQQHIPQNSDRKQALEFYSKALKDAGLSPTVALPTGEVVVSSNPAQVGKKIKLKKKPAVTPEHPFQISAELSDAALNPTNEAKTQTIEFPVVQGDHVLGYVQIKGEIDPADDLVHKKYRDTLALIVCTMLIGMFAVVYLAFRFTAPIDQLVEGAQQVAKGNLYVSLPQGGGDEMGKLSGTFNQMVERLRESRELQDRLNQAEKQMLLGRFAAVVAHEVRNSLNFINLSIDQIRAKHSDGNAQSHAELQRNLKNIKEEIVRLNSLVNDFLSVGRQMPPALAPCDLRETLEQALSLAEKQSRQQHVRLSSTLPPDLPPFQLDAGQIKTCFLNILTNAIQAMPGGGEVNITSQIVSGGSGSQSLQLRFADTGPGIPPEDRDKVFTPFYSTKATGFGLGLAITKKVVEDHGGRVFVTSGNTPGTVVVLELPMPGTGYGARDTGHDAQEAVEKV